jgi:two-component system sensor histidine kinase/response regulator
MGQNRRSGKIVLNDLLKQQIADSSKNGVLDQEELFRKISDSYNYLQTSQQTDEKSPYLTRALNLLESQADAVVIFNTHGKLTYYGENAESVFGYTREEAFSRRFDQFFAAESRERVNNAYREIVLEKKSRTYTLNIPNRQGNQLTIDVFVTPWCQEPEAEFIALVRDISRQRESEQKLLMLAHAIRSISESVSITDMENNILFVNEAFEKIYGYTEQEVIGKPVTILRDGNIDPKDIILSSTLHGGWQGEVVNRKKDGSKFPIMLSTSMIMGPDNQPLALIGVSRDITEEKQAQEELHLAKEAAEQANKDLTLINRHLEETTLLAKEMALQADLASAHKSEFLANMSHEIRTPLNGILGMTELTLETDLTAEQREYLGLAQSSAKSLLSIINDVLDFSKIEAGRLELDHIPFDLRSCISDALKSVIVKIHAKKLELVYFIAPNVPDKLIGDGNRLRQVLINLIGNALKFTEKGGITLFVGLADKQPEEGSVNLYFSLSDSGIGIPKDKQQRIFDSFTQADGSTSRRYGGTGLGLTISAKLVRMMNGKVWVSSPAVNDIPGFEPSPVVKNHPGSTFHFYARFTLDTMAQDEKSAVDLQLGKSQKVLVMDDYDVSLFVAAADLRKLGFTVDAWKADAESLSRLRKSLENKPEWDVVLLDYSVEAVQMVAELRAQQLPDCPPLILMIPTGNVGEKERAARGHFNTTISKPFNSTDLYRVLVNLPEWNQQANGAVPAELNTDLPESSGSLLPAAAASGYDVLVAEDNMVNQKLMLRLLEKRGHKVTMVANGKLAVEAVREKQYDVVFMDLQMPVLSGFDATDQIRRWERKHKRHTLIVALTAHAMKGDRERCIAGGMDGYLSKPIQSAELYDLLANLNSLKKKPVFSE